MKFSRLQVRKYLLAIGSYLAISTLLAYAIYVVWMLWKEIFD